MPTPTKEVMHQTSYTKLVSFHSAAMIRCQLYFIKRSHYFGAIGAQRQGIPIQDEPLIQLINMRSQLLSRPNHWNQYLGSDGAVFGSVQAQLPSCMRA